MLSRPEEFVLAIHYGLLGIIALFGMHRLYFLIHHAFLKPKEVPPAPEPTQVPVKWPKMLVQLPLYNEPSVAGRLIDAVCAMEYQPGLLEIQVLDDSTDETTDVLAERVRWWRSRGVDITQVRRPNREGFKAGALAHGLSLSDAELVTIFDADFLPPADFLTRLVGEFEDPKVGLVQARWEHLNREENLLTATQATFLDSHFHLEHSVRAATDHFFNFNGTAGIWRRATIDDAGGWQGDTLTEDLDLSYRAQLKGWRFVYRGDVTAPAELPSSFSAYRSQQRRWAKGSAETARKLLGQLLKADLPIGRKLEGMAHLLGNITYLLLLGIVLIGFPAFLVREFNGLRELAFLDLALLLPATGAFAMFFAKAARLSGANWFRTAYLTLSCLMVGIGMSLGNGVAVIEGFLRRPSPFVRTPKRGDVKTRSVLRAPGRAQVLPLAELSVAGHFVLMLATAWCYRVTWTIPSTLLFASGFFFVGALSLFEELKAFAGFGEAGRRPLPGPMPYVPGRDAA